MKGLVIFIRSLIFTLGQAVFAIFFGITGLLLVLMPLKVRYRWITLFSHLVIWWAKVICGIDYAIHGIENLPDKNAIVLCKHQSTWETLFLQVLLPHQSWVLKKQLLYIPFFGWGLSLLKPIAIDRNKKSSALKQLTEQGKARLDSGSWVVLFPEGSRIPVGKKSRYSRSGAGLAIATGYPVVCIALNAGLFWPKNSFLKYPGTVELRISQAIDPKGLDVSTLHEMIVSFIENNSNELTKSALRHHLSS